MRLHLEWEEARERRLYFQTRLMRVTQLVTAQTNRGRFASLRRRVRAVSQHVDNHWMARKDVGSYISCSFWQRTGCKQHLLCHVLKAAAEVTASCPFTVHVGVSTAFVCNVATIQRFFHPWNFFLCRYYCNRHNATSSRQKPETIFLLQYHCLSVPTTWPTAAVSLKFLHIIKRKDELICSDLKQDQNTGFPNPSFFFIRGGEEHFTPVGEKERGSYFTLHQFHCFYEDLFLPSTCPTSVHSVTEFMRQQSDTF